MTTEEHIKSIIVAGIDHIATPKFTLPVGVAAVFSGSWLPSAESISAWATLWLPVFGVTLIVLQIIKLIWDWAFRKPKP